MCVGEARYLGCRAGFCSRSRAQLNVLANFIIRPTCTPDLYLGSPHTSTSMSHTTPSPSPLDQPPSYDELYLPMCGSPRTDYAPANSPQTSSATGVMVIPASNSAIDFVIEVRDLWFLAVFTETCPLTVCISGNQYCGWFYSSKSTAGDVQSLRMLCEEI